MHSQYLILRDQKLLKQKSPKEQVSGLQDLKNKTEKQMKEEQIQWKMM
jgi:hypothetical protein